MKENIYINLILWGLIMLNSGCSKSDDFQSCDSSSIVSSSDNICLAVEHGELSNSQQALIEAKVISGLKSISQLMSINDLRIRIVENQQLVIPEIGIGGFNPDAHEVIVAINTDYQDLESTLEKNFISILAHEIHHAKRRRSVGYGKTLLEGMISEGLADHFSIEVTGIQPPPWSLALGNSELQNWIETASNSWNESYNHAAWFLGADPNIPKWTGYSIGFELVKNYLVRNPDRLPSNLHDEPAISFAP